METSTAHGKVDIALSYFLYPLEDRAVPIRVLTGDGAGNFTDATTALFGGQPPVTVHGRQMRGGRLKQGRPRRRLLADHGYDAAPFPGARNALFLSTGATGLTNATTRLPALADYSHSAAAGDIDRGRRHRLLCRQLQRRDGRGLVFPDQRRRGQLHPDPRGRRPTSSRVSTTRRPACCSTPTGMATSTTCC
ncbi:hypothetical protein ACRAWD_29815 [Caulobacter segnis]